MDFENTTQKKRMWKEKRHLLFLFQIDLNLGPETKKFSN